MKSWFRVLIFCTTALLATSIPPFPRQDDDHEDSWHRGVRSTGSENPSILSRTRRSLADLSDETTADFWNYGAQNALKNKLRQKLNTNKAKNVIMFLGDGMSVPTLMAARTYLGQLQGNTGEEEALHWESFPYTGLSKSQTEFQAGNAAGTGSYIESLYLGYIFTQTYCVDAQVPDSACTATAYLCGVKTNDGTIGVNAKITRGNCESSINTTNHLSSIAEWSLDNGKSAGIVTTTRVTHASPSGAYARVADRDWESDYNLNADGINATLCPDIATQLVTTYPGKDFQVILGGGRREFLPDTVIDDEGTSGRRLDGVDLIETWKQDKADRDSAYSYVWNRKGLRQIIDNPDDVDYVLGLFENTHCQYQKEAVAETEPTLSEMTEAAIKILQKNNNGYFLFVEGGRIDHAHHDTWTHLALGETVEFANAVRVADELTDEEDTLIVVTSDHAHVMSVSGYPVRGNDILGIADNSDVDGLPYLTLSYANGPGYKTPNNYTRYDLTNDDLTELRYAFPTMVPLDSETHGGDDVAIFARGPWAHLFTGTVEQNTIPHFMAYASCVGNGLTACTGGGK